METPVGFQPRVVAIVGARLVIDPDTTIDVGNLVVREGLITALGKEATVPAGADIIDGQGLVVYPGFLDIGNSRLLDPEQGPTPVPGRKSDATRTAFAATPRDNRKSLTPEFAAEEGLRKKQAGLETLRKQGVASVLVLPDGRIASGQGVHLVTSGAPLREALLVGKSFSVFELRAPGKEGYPATLMGAFAHLRQALLDAQRHQVHQDLYAKGVSGIPRPTVDPALDALGALQKTSGPAVFRAQSRDEILRALSFCAEQKLSPVIWGGRDADLCIDQLKASEASLILRLDWGDEPDIEKPAADDLVKKAETDPERVQQDRLQRWQERVAVAGALHAAGIPFVFSSEGLKDQAEFGRSIRKAIAAGLPARAAVAALTRNAAQLVGQESHLGTLAVGKLAHVTVLNGPLESETSLVRYLLVDGIKFEYAKPSETDLAGAGTKDAIDLSGTWNLEITAADGNVPAELELRQSQGKLVGTFRSGQGEGRVTAGTLDKRQVRLTVSIGAGAQSLELRFEGSPDDKAENLSGTLKSAFGAATKWTAVRQPVEAPRSTAKNPIELQLDDDDNPSTTVRTAAATDAAGTPGTAPAASPASKGTSGDRVPLPQDPAFPTELERDRLHRGLKTGGQVLIRNATVLTMTSPPLKQTSILVRDGRIAAIGANLTADPNMAVIDASGLYVMPGIIDTHSHIMFADGMRGVNESTRSIVAEVRVKDVLRTDDPAQYRALAGGVTLVRLLHGSANVIGGQHAVVKLKYGEPLDQQILADAPKGIKFALGENVKFRSERFPNTRLGVEATLNRAFVEALQYRQQWREYRQSQKAADHSQLTATDKATDKATDAETASSDHAADQPATTQGAPRGATPASAGSAPRPVLPPRRDLRLEALAEILDQERFIHCHCYRADEILMLLRMAESHGIRIRSLQHVLEGYKVGPEIAAHGASCSTFADWWAYKVEAYDAIPHNAALLSAAGANVVIKSDDPELMRHLYHEASKSVRYEMAPDAALQAITINAARELGLDDRMGTIEVGKEAHLAIFSGHPLNAFSRCEWTLIDGEVYFSRKSQPGVLSAKRALASAHPAPLNIPEVRHKPLDLKESATSRYALVGGTLHPLDGPIVEQGTLLIDDGKIAGIGTSVELPPDCQRIDVSGLHVYPGLIDAGTVLGLTEIGKVRETHDYSESGRFQPDLHAGVAVNPDSELIPVARAGGITTIHLRLTGGVIGGQSSVVQLSGWTAPEMILEESAGLQINWPSGKDGPEEIEALKQFLSDARLYAKAKGQSEDAQPHVTADPRFEALLPYVSGEKQVFIEANSRKEIAEAMKFAEEESLKIVLTGGTDAWKLATELKQREIPVIVGPLMRTPLARYDPYDAPYANPGRLHEAGVRFCIRSNNAANSRNTPFEAAMAVAYGLPEQVALEAVTIAAARILKIDDRVGTLTPGKIANVIVCDGSPLQPTTCYQAVFVSGRPYAPESRQTRLYDKYLARLQEIRTNQATAAGANKPPAAKESAGSSPGGAEIRPGGS